MQAEKRPIGYWVKQTDELLTKGINDVLASLEISRTGWQLLNSIGEQGTLDIREAENLLRPFADAETITGMLNTFSGKDLLEEEAGSLCLPNKGVELHRLCLKKIKQFR